MNSEPPLLSPLHSYSELFWYTTPFWCVLETRFVTSVWNTLDATEGRRSVRAEANSRKPPNFRFSNLDFQRIWVAWATRNNTTHFLVPAVCHPPPCVYRGTWTTQNFTILGAYFKTFYNSVFIYKLYIFFIIEFNFQAKIYQNQGGCVILSNTILTNSASADQFRSGSKHWGLRWGFRKEWRVGGWTMTQTMTLTAHYVK